MASERVIPFGLGKRFCMGETLARKQIFLFSVNLLQRLRFLPPQADNAAYAPPDPTSYTANFTTIPKHFHVKIQPIQ